MLSSGWSLKEGIDKRDGSHYPNKQSELYEN